MTFKFLKHKLLLCTLLFAQFLIAKSNESTPNMCDNIPMDLVLIGQEAINEFPILYSGCEVVQNISIEGAFNLSALSQIRTINGNFTIRNNPELFETAGLEFLTAIGGDFMVEDNPNLFQLIGLENLKTVGGDVSIARNNTLMNFVGLFGLNSIAGTLKVENNNTLMDFIGLENLTSARSISITDNPSLFNLIGLFGLQQIESNLRIERNSLLDDLSGADGLTSVGSLTIADSPNLFSLFGLEQLKQVRYGLNITRNANLSDITALEQIETFPISNTFINSNPRLSQCSLSSICQHLQNIGSMNFFGNAVDCNSEAEVLANCEYAEPEPNLQIISASCPVEFPQPNSSLTYEITISNIGNAPSEGMPLYLHRGRFSDFLAIAPLEIDNVFVPAMAAGETRDFTFTFNYDFDVIYPPNYQDAPESIELMAALSFERNTPFQDNHYPVDLFCKKTNTDLELVITSRDNTYTENDNDFSYRISVTNRSQEAAYNLQVMYYERELLAACHRNRSNNIANSYYTGGLPDNMTVTEYWNIPKLESGTTAYLDVTDCVLQSYKREGIAIPDEFIFRTSITSPHLVDPNPSDNTASIRFFEGLDPARLEVTAASCPEQFPKRGDSLTYLITVANTGDMGSTPTPLGLFRKLEGVRYALFGVHTFGLVNVPPIEAGETLSFEASFPYNDPRFRGDFADDLQIAEAYFSFDMDGLAGNEQDGLADQFEVDLYCKKYTSDIELQLETPQGSVYEEDGIIRYQVVVKNNGTETAHNLRVQYAVNDPSEGYGFVQDIYTTFEASYTSRIGISPFFQLWNIETLAVGEIATLNVVYKLANERATNMLPLQYTFSSRVISPHLADDPNPNNNTASTNFTKVVPPEKLIDLELSLETDSPDIGQWERGTFVFTLENKGETIATDVSVRINLNGYRVVLVGGIRPSASHGIFGNNVWTGIHLAAGSTATLELRLFNKVSDLSFTAEVIAANETDLDSTPNNQISTEDDFVRFVAATPLPDLVLQNFESPLVFRAGSLSRFALEIANIGTATARGDFDITFALTQDLSSTGITIGNIRTGNLGVATYPSTAAVNIPAQTPEGSYFLVATIDANQQIEEQNEQNNVVVMPVTVDSGRRQVSFTTPSQSSIRVAPNPASESLHLLGSYKANSNYQIFDIHARLVKTGKLHNGEIDLENLSTGVYHLTLDTDNRPIRFVKVD